MVLQCSYEPHLEDTFETMIKLAKQVVSNILTNTDIIDGELHIAFTAAESLLNLYPLTYLTASIKDIMSRTPNHFLFGQLGGSLLQNKLIKKIIIQRNIGNKFKSWKKLLETMDTGMVAFLTPMTKMEQKQRDLREGNTIGYITRDTTRKIVIMTSINPDLGGLFRGSF